MKPKVLHLLPSSLSARISLWVVGFVAVLFMVTFSLMFVYARRAIKTEMAGKGEDYLQKLEITIANIVREKEVVARQTQRNVEMHLDNPAKIDAYLQDLLKKVPEIIGVAAAFEPGFYPSHQGEYMIYYHRKGNKLVKSEQFAGESYMHQPWYEETMKRNDEYWSEPQENYRTDNQPIVSFGLPLRKDGKTIGVFAIDISLFWLSKTVTAQHPTPTMYGAMATSKGMYVVHPDTAMLRAGAIFRMLNATTDKVHTHVMYKMLGGEKGMASIELNGTKYFVAYRPVEGTNCVIDIVCPEDEMMGNYNHMISLVVLVIILALLLMVAFFYFFVHRQMVPLRTLEASAKLMTQGDYTTPVAARNSQDEVGSLANSFIAMRQSIKQHIEQIKHTRKKLDAQNKALAEANEHIKEADRVKSAFLQNMTDQMEEPVNKILDIVTQVKEHGSKLTQDEMKELANQMNTHTHTVTTLLDRTLDVATKREEGEV